MRRLSLRALFVVLACVAYCAGLCPGEKNSGTPEQAKGLVGQAPSPSSLPTLPNGLFAPGRITLSTRIEREGMEPGYIKPILSPDGEHIARLLPSGKDGKDLDFVVDSPSDPEIAKTDQLFGYARLLRGCALNSFSPDSRHFAYVREGDDHQSPQDPFRGDHLSQQVVLDGKPGRQYAAITELTFSPDGKRFAFIAMAKEGGPNHPFGDMGNLFVVLDGKELVGSGPVIQPAGARTGEQTGPMARQLSSRPTTEPTTAPASEAPIGWAKEATFSPGSKHFAYILDANPAHSTMHVVVDGVAGKDYALVGSLSWTGDNRLVYIAGVAGHGAPDPREFCVVVDGKEQKHYPKLVKDSLRVSPAGKIVYMASDSGRDVGWLGNLWGPFCVVSDGVEGKKYLKIWQDSMYFDAAGTFCYVAGVPVVKHDPAPTMETELDLDHQAFRLGGRAVVGAKESAYKLPEGRSNCLCGPWPCITSPDGRAAVLGAECRDEGADVPYGITQNGFAHQLYRTIDLVCFSPDDKHVAYIAKKDRSGPKLLVVDGIEFPINIKGVVKVLRYVRQDSLVALVEDTDQTTGYPAKAKWSKIRLTLFAK